MIGKSPTHQTRTPQDWEQLVERYYAGETSLREEEELRRFLFSKESGDAYDDTRAVLAFSETGRRLARPRIKNRRHLSLHVRTAAAVGMALLLGGGLFYIVAPRDTCVAYVYGEKHTDPAVVIEQLQHSVSQFAETGITVESQFDDIFSPLETLP